MIPDYSIREKTTEAIEFSLTSVDAMTGIETPQILTGATLTNLVLTSRTTGIQRTIPSGQLAIADAANGKVQYVPTITDLLADDVEYGAHITLSIGGAPYTYPSNRDFVIYVFRG